MKYFPILLAASLFFTSCSLSSELNRVAHKTILKDQHFKNAHTGIAIYDEAGDKLVYSYQSEKYFVPASNTKLASCYAAMKYLGDSIPALMYEVENDSTVKIQGTGDPTFLHPDFKLQPGWDFLKQFKRIDFVSNNFNQFLGNGWAWNDYDEDYMAGRSQFPVYGNVVRFSEAKNGLTISPGYFKNNSQIANDIKNGIAVSRPWSENNFVIKPGRSKYLEVPFLPADSTVVALLSDTLHASVFLTSPGNSTENLRDVLHSQPLDSMLSRMMYRSDNFYAEQSLLMVSQKVLGQMNDRSIINKLLETEYKDMPQKPSWVDGSGLSRYNLFSPQDFIFILQKMKNEFGMERIKKILPTGGTGTISSLYLDDAGSIFVKTGTLNGVVALSGYLYTKKNKLLLFSVLINNHRSSASDIRKGIEKFIQSVRNKF